MLQPQGYYVIDDLLDALAVSLPFLEQEITNRQLVSSISIYDQPWFRQDHVHTWLARREPEIAAEQARLRELKAETVR